MKHFQILQGYPIGWEWLKTIPRKDMDWLSEILALTTDNTDVYDYMQDRAKLARLMDWDQGTIAGYKLYAQYLIAKVKGWTSEEEFMDHLYEINDLINEEQWANISNIVNNPEDFEI